MYTKCIHAKLIAKELLKMRPPIIFRLADEEYDQLLATAEKEGISPNQLAKDRVKESLQGGGSQLLLNELRLLRSAFDELSTQLNEAQDNTRSQVDPHLLEALLYLRGMSRPELGKAVRAELVRRGVNNDE